MTNRLDKFAKQARELSLRERSALIDLLVNSLDQLDEQECESLWLEEARRRVQGYEPGQVTSRPAEDIFLDTRAQLRTLA